MKFGSILLFFLVLACGSPQHSLAADAPPSLAHNPFSRPASEVPDYEVHITENTDGSGPSLALRATMVSSGIRLANVAGRILRIGEEIDGYRLVAVREDYAVFARGDKLMSVYVKPNRVDDDE